MATSNVDDGFYSKTLKENDRMEWVPLTLTLVEYPKGKNFDNSQLFPSPSPVVDICQFDVSNTPDFALICFR